MGRGSATEPRQGRKKAFDSSSRAALSYAPAGAGRLRTASQRSRAGLLAGAPTGLNTRCSRCTDEANTRFFPLLLVHVFQVGVAVQAFLVELEQRAAFLVSEAALAQGGFHIPAQLGHQ